MLDRLKKQLGIKDTPVSLEAQELQTQLASLKFMCFIVTGKQIGRAHA